MGSRQGTRWLAWAAGASLVSGAISGCGDGGAEPTATPTTTSTSAVPTTPAATPSPLVTAVPLPVMPPEMANNDAAGAEAAVRYFFGLYGYTYINQDLSAWEKISGSNCVFCNSVVEDVGIMIARGESQVGGLVQIEEVGSSIYNPELNVHVIELTARQEPYNEIGADGLVSARSEGGVFLLSAVVQFRDGNWILLEAGSD